MGSPLPELTIQASTYKTHILPGEQLLYKATLSPANAYGPAIVLAAGTVILGLTKSRR
jgi:hypothetical protein